jgi:Trypsin
MNAENYQIRVGSLLANYDGDVYRLEITVWHPNYEQSFSVDDIGLVKTTEPIRLSSTVQIARLSEAGASPPTTGTLCNVVGFGLTHVSNGLCP